MKNDNATKVFSTKQEHNVAEYLNMKVVAGSGSRDCKPGDVQSDSWLVECKTHTKRVDCIEFKQAHWKKICREADAKFRYPLLVTDLGTQQIKDTWVLCRYSILANSNIDLRNYRFPVRTNIKFDPVDMEKPYAYEIKFCDEKLYIMHIEIFKQILDGEL